MWLTYHGGESGFREYSILNEVYMNVTLKNGVMVSDATADDIKRLTELGMIGVSNGCATNVVTEVVELQKKPDSKPMFG